MFPLAENNSFYFITLTEKFLLNLYFWLLFFYILQSFSCFFLTFLPTIYDVPLLKFLHANNKFEYSVTANPEAATFKKCLALSNHTLVHFVSNFGDNRNMVYNFFSRIV